MCVIAKMLVGQRIELIRVGQTKHDGERDMFIVILEGREKEIQAHRAMCAACRKESA